MNRTRGEASRLDEPLCGANRELVQDVALVPQPGAGELAALVGRRARVEGAVSTRDASPAYFVALTRAATAGTR